MNKSEMKLSTPIKKNKIRPGRGISAGRGKTAGRGTKGQKSRAGHNIPKQFEGGQSNLSLRLPKIKGFKSNKNSCKAISLNDLSIKFKAGDTINNQSLIDAGLIKQNEIAKILSNGIINFYLKIEDIKISKSAQKAIDKNKETKKTPISKNEA